MHVYWAAMSQTGDTPPTRREIAIRAARARWDKRRAVDRATVEARGRPGPADIDIFSPVAPDPAPRAHRSKNRPTTDYQTIQDYDDAVGAPVDWGAAKRREEVRGELTLNETRCVSLYAARLELDKQRGKLVPKTELERLAAMIRDAWWSEAQQIGPQVMLALSDLSGEMRARIQAAINAQVEAAASRVRDAMRR